MGPNAAVVFHFVAVIVMLQCEIFYDLQSKCNHRLMWLHTAVIIVLQSRLMMHPYLKHLSGWGYFVTTVKRLVGYSITDTEYQ